MYLYSIDDDGISLTVAALTSNRLIKMMEKKGGDQQDNFPCEDNGHIKMIYHSVVYAAYCKLILYRNK